MTLSKMEAYKKMSNSAGKIFRVDFLKKNGEHRVMVCRTEVKKGVKGVGMSYDPTSKALLTVYDVQKKAFRMVNLETVTALNIENEKYEVN